MLKYAGITLGLVSPLLVGTIAQLVKSGYGTILMNVGIVVGCSAITAVSVAYIWQARS